MSHIASRVKGEGPYVEDFNSTLLGPFLEGVCPTKEVKLGWTGEKLCVRHCNLEPDNIG